MAKINHALGEVLLMKALYLMKPWNGAKSRQVYMRNFYLSLCHNQFRIYYVKILTTYAEEQLVHEASGLLFRNRPVNRK